MSSSGTISATPSQSALATSTETSSIGTNSKTIQIFGPGASTIISSEYAVRFNGSKWAIALGRNASWVESTLIAIFAKYIGVPASFVEISSMSVGSLVVRFVIYRNGTYAIPDATILEIVKNFTDYGDLGTVYEILTNESSSDVVLLSSALTRSSQIGTSDVTCSTACVAGIATGVTCAVLMCLVLALCWCHRRNLQGNGKENKMSMRRRDRNQEPFEEGGDSSPRKSPFKREESSRWMARKINWSKYDLTPAVVDTSTSKQHQPYESPQPISGELFGPSYVEDDNRNPFELDEDVLVGHMSNYFIHSREGSRVGSISSTPLEFADVRPREHADDVVFYDVESRSWEGSSAPFRGALPPPSRVGLARRKLGAALGQRRGVNSRGHSPFGQGAFSVSRHSQESLESPVAERKATPPCSTSQHNSRSATPYGTAASTSFLDEMLHARARSPPRKDLQPLSGPPSRPAPPRPPSSLSQPQLVIPAPSSVHRARPNPPTTAKHPHQSPLPRVAGPPRSVSPQSDGFEAFDVEEEVFDAQHRHLHLGHGEHRVTLPVPPLHRGRQAVTPPRALQPRVPGTSPFRPHVPPVAPAVRPVAPAPPTRRQQHAVVDVADFDFFEVNSEGTSSLGAEDVFHTTTDFANIR